MGLAEVYDSIDNAVADIPDGAAIMMSAFGGAGGQPTNLQQALLRQGAKELTVIAHVIPTIDFELGGTGLANFALGLKYPPGWKSCSELFIKRRVKKWIGGVFLAGIAEQLLDLMRGELGFDELETELIPQGTFAERIRAGGAGIKGFYTIISTGTEIGIAKETRIIDGEECVFEYPLRADYAFVRAYKADKIGNLIYRGTSRGFGPLMATAADTTIVEVDDIVEVGELDPEVIITPSIYVDRIVKVPKPWWNYREFQVKEGTK